MQTAILTLTAFILAVHPAAAPQDSTSELLERAIFTEETVGDLDAAIELYREIVARAETARPFVAQAQFRLGLCHLKKGERDAAVSALQKLVADFPKQAELVARARAQLGDLGLPVPGGAPAVRQVWEGTATETLGSPSPDGRFFSRRDGGELAVLDTATGGTRLLTSGSKQVRCFGVADSVVSPDGQRVACCWWDRETPDSVRESASLDVVELDGSRRRLCTPSAALELRPLDWTPDGGHVLVAWREDERGTVIALVSAEDGTARVLKTMKSDWPLGASVSPSGEWVAYDVGAADSTQRDIRLLQTDGEADLALLAHPASDYGPLWTPDGDALFFLSDRGGALGGWIVPVAEGKTAGPPVLAVSDAGPMRPMGFSRDGALFYMLEARRENVYTVELDAETGRATGEPRSAVERFVGFNRAPEWSPDGQVLAYLSRRSVHAFGPGAWNLVLRSDQTGSERALASELTLWEHYKPRWSPDGRLAVVTGFDPEGRQGFYGIDASTGETTTVHRAAPGVIVEEVSWSPDGKSVFYDSHPTESDACTLVRKDLTSGREEVLVEAPAPLSINFLATSPDGEHVAYIFTDGASKTNTLNVIPSGGGGTRELARTRLPERISSGLGVVWTPDGRHVIYGTATFGGTDFEDGEWGRTEVWRVSAEGGEPAQLGIAVKAMAQLSIHPDGRRLAFSAGRNRSEVWIMENFLPNLQATR